MKSLHRFYLPARDCRDDTLLLQPGDSSHALKALRLRKGDRFCVLDGAGHELLCSLESERSGRVEARVLSRSDLPAPACSLNLIQGVPRSRSMDWIVQKATELGCRRILPVLSERSVVRLGPEEARARKERWDSIAIESMKQCGQGWKPEIHVPQPLERLLSGPPPAGLSLLASLAPGAAHPRSALGDFLGEGGREPGGISFWVGPEGDYTPSEINRIRASGARPVTLGPLILRSETAAVYALSILSYELGSAADLNPPAGRG